MDSLYSVAFILSAVVSLLIGLAAWKRRPAPGALGLAILSFAQFQWSVVYAMQWMFTDHGPSTFWFLFRFIGLQTTPTAILILVLEFTGRSRWLRTRNVVLLLIQPVTMYLLAITDHLHGLYLGGLPPYLKIIAGGPAWWFNIAYSYALMLFAAGLLVARLRRRYPYRLQTTVVLIAVMLPVIHFLVQLTGFELLPAVNSVPFTFTISGILNWYALTRLGLFRVVPIARDQLIEQMPEGIIVFDVDRRIADINPAATRMTGAVGSCIGQTADEAFPLYAATIAELREQLALGRTHAVAQAPYGTDRMFEATASVMKNRQQQPFATLVSLRDVTDRYAAERMQRGFVANAAHELQTPLTGLALLADTIPRALQDDPERAKGFIDRLAVEINRLIRMTNELMTLSRVGEPIATNRLVLLNISRLAEEEMARVAFRADEMGQSLSMSPSENIELWADETDVRSVLSNLLHNAIRYSGASGHIAVSVRRENDAEGHQWAVLEVSDDGPGIPLEDQAHIFERFYRVDKGRSRQTGGAGLGLSIVLQAAERHGGTATVQSLPGKGATFTVRLPIGQIGDHAHS